MNVCRLIGCQPRWIKKAWDANRRRGGMTIVKAIMSSILAKILLQDVRVSPLNSFRVCQWFVVFMFIYLSCSELGILWKEVAILGLFGCDIATNSWNNYMTEKHLWQLVLLGGFLRSHNFLNLKNGFTPCLVHGKFGKTKGQKNMRNKRGNLKYVKFICLLKLVSLIFFFFNL